MIECLEVLLNKLEFADEMGERIIEIEAPFLAKLIEEMKAQKKETREATIEEIKEAFIQIDSCEYATFTLCFVKELLDEMKTKSFAKFMEGDDGK